MKISKASALAMMVLVHPALSFSRHTPERKVQEKLNASSIVTMDEGGVEEMKQQPEKSSGTIDQLSHHTPSSPTPGSPSSPTPESPTSETPTPTMTPTMAPTMAPPPEFSLQCAKYEQLLAAEECYCGVDKLGLCPDECGEEEFLNFCLGFEGLSNSNPKCPFCFETCPLSCLEYVKECCPCHENKIVSLDSKMLDIDEPDEVECEGPYVFDECGPPAIIAGEPDPSLCEAARGGGDIVVTNGGSSSGQPCEERLYTCMHGFTGQSIWLSLAETYRANFKFNDYGPGFELYCGGKVSAVFLWKATRQEVTVKKTLPDECTVSYNVTVSQGFYGSDQCGRVNYTCHTREVEKYYDDYKPGPYAAQEQQDVSQEQQDVSQEQQDIATEEVDKSHYYYGVDVMYRDVIKDCCGWFISSAYPQGYPPYSCDRIWYHFDPTPLGKEAGIIGHEATPCFTNLEWVGIRVDAYYKCYRRDLEEEDIEQAGGYKYVNVIGEYFFGDVPYLACDDCCADTCAPELAIDASDSSGML